MYIQKNFPEIEVIKTLYVYENPKDIRKIKLPDYCIIKATFGGGGYRNIVITPNNKITKIAESKATKTLLKSVDILGRETIRKGFNIKIYDDGSVDKKYLLR